MGWFVDDIERTISRPGEVRRSIEALKRLAVPADQLRGEAKKVLAGVGRRKRAGRKR